MSIAQWVRQALNSPRREEPLGSMDRKLAVIRAAAQHEFPSGDIDHMLAEIETGYMGGTR